MARGGNFWLGIAIGATAGAITALLSAPKRGSEMRDDIKGTAKDIGRKAGAAWGDVKDKTTNAAKSAQEKLQQASSKGQTAMQSTKEKVQEAVDEGRKAAEEKRAEMKADMERQNMSM